MLLIFQCIVKAERRNERKNKVYSNMNVVLEQTKNNVHYKTCDTTYNKRLKELVDNGKVLLRGLKDNAIATGKSTNHKKPAVENDWKERTVASILERLEYTGCTVNFRSTTRSFKDHRKIKNPKEQWKIFENTHEPIIDENTFNLVQKIRENRQRPTRTGRKSIFQGKVYCNDCKAKMYFCTFANKKQIVIYIDVQLIKIIIIQENVLLII